MVKNALEDAALASTRSMAEKSLGDIASIGAALEKSPAPQPYAHAPQFEH